MDFELTDDQHDLRDLVRGIAEKECPTTLVRSVAEQTDEGEVDALWSTFVGLDWPTLTIPSECGGMGLTAVELGITAEELGRVADPSPLLATASQYAALVRECFDPRVRASLLGAVCTGTTGAVAFDTPGVSAHRGDSGWVLDGTARNVIDGDRAERIAIVVEVDGAPAVFEMPSERTVATRKPTFDATLHLAEVEFSAAEAEHVATGTEVANGVHLARLEATTILAASMVGSSQRILEMVLDHVKTREQFDVPIGSFQAVKHMAVDMYVSTERARALVQFSTLALAEHDERRTLAASMAKAAAGDCQRLCAQHGIQLFGGLGYTWENDLQLFVRRAKSGEPLLGTSAEHRAAVARNYSQPESAALVGSDS